MGNYFSKVDELNQIIERQDKVINNLKNKIKLLEKQQIIQQGGAEIPDIEKIKNDKDYEYLAFSGGGIKGVSYIGVIEGLYEMGILENIKGFAGTSAGSIIATLLALGLTVNEISVIMNDLNFEDILDDKFGILRDCVNLIDNFGICEGIYMYNMLGDIIEERFGDPDFTIKQLYDDRNVILIITATDINNMKTIYLHPHSHIKEYRDIPIRTAVRMSICIPFIFEPVSYNNDMYVDGAVMDNYPVHVFDGEFPSEYNKMNISDINTKVLGLNIVTEDNDSPYISKIDNLYEYSIGFINMFFRENETRIMTPINRERTVNIKVPAYPLTRFNLSKDDKDNLIRIGKNTIYKYFKN